MIVTMAKKIKWQDGMRGASSKGSQPQVQLLWLQPGALANLVMIDRAGKGWSTEKRLRVIDKVVIVDVLVGGTEGYSNVLRNGHMETVQNKNLRPTTC